MFFTRLLSSIVLVLVALVTLLRGGYLLAAVLLLISLVAYRELCKACNLNIAPSMDFFGLSLGVILCFPIIIPVR